MSTADAADVEAGLDRIVVLDALSALSAEHRDVIMQTYYAGRTVDEDAVVTPIAHKRRPSTRWLLSAAAAVVVLAAGGTAAGIAVSHSSSRPATTFASETAGDISLRVAATDLGHRTRLELTAKGLRNHEHCRLVARAADGSTHPAGTWDASYEGEAQVVETTDVPRFDIRSLTLYGDGGRRLVVVTT